MNREILKENMYQVITEAIIKFMEAQPDPACKHLAYDLAYEFTDNHLNGVKYLNQITDNDPR